MSHARRPSIRTGGPQSLFAVHVLAAAMLALAFIIQTTAPASASIGWCRSDPIVVVDLAIADVFTSAKWTDLDKINGPTQVVVVVPSTVKTLIGIPTLGFGYWEHVSFERSNGLKQTRTQIEVIVKVFVPSTDNAMPIRVEFAPRLLGLLAPTTESGYANKWIVFKAVL